MDLRFYSHNLSRFLCAYFLASFTSLLTMRGDKINMGRYPGKFAIVLGDWFLSYSFKWGIFKQLLFLIAVLYLTEHTFVNAFEMCILLSLPC